jgi:hypothetical protein
MNFIIYKHMDQHHRRFFTLHIQNHMDYYDKLFNFIILQPFLFINIRYLLSPRMLDGQLQTSLQHTPYKRKTQPTWPKLASTTGHRKVPLDEENVSAKFSRHHILSSWKYRIVYTRERGGNYLDEPFFHSLMRWYSGFQQFPNHLTAF